MTAAKAYASALYQVASEGGLRSAALQELSQVLGQLALGFEESQAILTGVLSSATSPRARGEFAEKVCKELGADETLARFVALVAKAGRIMELRLIADAFESLRIQKEGGIVGELASAEPLSPADLEALKRTFADKTGKTVTFRTSIDPALLAGVKVSVQGVTYDGTLLSQIRQLRERLTTPVSSA